MTQPMPATRRQHWAQINEFSFVAGMRLLFSTCRILGRWPFRIVLYPVLLWYVVTKPEARASSSDYLRRVAAYQGGFSYQTRHGYRVTPFCVIRRKPA